MQVNPPQVLQPPVPTTTHNSRKSQKTPYRTQISLKSKRNKNIPQIKIELDQMLNEAFHEMQLQPKKNIRLGKSDLYILDNQLLRNYVTAVYDQYGIQDPLAFLDNRSSLHTQKNDKNVGSRLFHTPQKPSSSFNQINTTNSKIQHKINKTTQRLSKLKQNFQSELQTMPTVFIQDQSSKTHKKTIAQPSSKRLHIKLGRRVSEQIDSKSQSRKKVQKLSYLLVKTRHKYCLMCDQPLQTGLINNHQRQCEQLQKLLNTPNLKLQQITQILQNKINALQKQLQFSQYNIKEDTNKIQQLLKSINNTCDVILNNQQQEEQDHALLLKKFSMFNTVKCMEIIDKIKWFRKMKAKAQQKKGGVGGII